MEDTFNPKNTLLVYTFFIIPSFRMCKLYKFTLCYRFFGLKINKHPVKQGSFSSKFGN